MQQTQPVKTTRVHHQRSRYGINAVMFTLCLLSGMAQGVITDQLPQAANNSSFPHKVGQFQNNTMPAFLGQALSDRTVLKDLVGLKNDTLAHKQLSDAHTDNKPDIPLWQTKPKIKVLNPIKAAGHAAHSLSPEYKKLPHKMSRLPAASDEIEDPKAFCDRHESDDDLPENRPADGKPGTTRILPSFSLGTTHANHSPDDTLTSDSPASCDTAILSSLASQQGIEYRQVSISDLVNQYKELLYNCQCQGFTTLLGSEKLYPFESLFQMDCPLHSPDEQSVVFHGTLKKSVKSFIENGIEPIGKGHLGGGFYVTFNPIHAIRHVVSKGLDPFWHWNNNNTTYATATPVLLGQLSMRDALEKYYNGSQPVLNPDQIDGNTPVILKIAVDLKNEVDLSSDVPDNNLSVLAHDLLLQRTYQMQKQYGVPMSKTVQLQNDATIIQCKDGYMPRLFSHKLNTNTGQSILQLNTKDIREIWRIMVKYLCKKQSLRKLKVIEIIELQ